MTGHNGWETVIGLEVHVQLSTRSKIFSGAANAFGAEPNALACPVDLGLPGVLPVLNREAVRMAVLFGLAIEADIRPRSRFERKNYFYPDLPKGYQISQFELPIVSRGRLPMPPGDSSLPHVRILRAHLEEDAGKSTHDAWPGKTGIDLNRAGAPLLEVVSDPDMRQPAQAAAFFRQMRSLVRYLGICDGDLSQGSMRCDVNVSVRPAGSEQLGERVEIKNLNSFRFVERAVAHEADRQIALLEEGQSLARETRLYDPDADATRPMRGKELSDDYRYFPDPDLLPLEIDDAFIAETRRQLPELPWDRRRRFERELGLSAYDARRLAEDPGMADYFETVASVGDDSKLAANWVLGELAGKLNRAETSVAECPLPASELGALIHRIRDNTLSSKMAKEVFEALWASEGAVDAIIAAKGLQQISDRAELARLAEQVVARHPKQATQFRAGRDKLLGFFVGQLMRETGGKADPRQANSLLRDALGRTGEKPPG